MQRCPECQEEYQVQHLVMRGGAWQQVVTAPKFCPFCGIALSGDGLAIQEGLANALREIADEPCCGDPAACQKDPRFCNAGIVRAALQDAGLWG
jgi:hypothetical protein